MRSPPISLGLLAVTAIAAAGLGQQDPDSIRSTVIGGRSSAPPFIDATAGVQLLDGELVGGGPDYRVRFGERGIEFTPALGKRAPREMPWTFTCDSFGRRGGSRLSASSQPVRSHDATTVRYGHDAVVETYEVRRDGVEQSFVFAKLPPGGGDLVVRGRVDTELAPRPSEAGLGFWLDGVGGVTVEKVVGVDANGARVAGWIALDGEHLELGLPARFVDEAALPLVLDPVIGTAIDVNSLLPSDYDDFDPDIAYDASTDRFLAVWTRRFSATNYDVRGQLVDGTTKALVGSYIAVTNSAGAPYESYARVANVAVRDRFLVVWNENANIYGRSVAATSALGPQLTILDDTSALIAPDVGGEATPVDDDAIVCWWDSTNNDIEARQIGINADGSLNLSGPVVQIGGAGYDDSLPAISKTGGASGHHLIVWQRSFSGAYAIRGATIDRNVTILNGLIGITGTTPNHNDPDCDGDGSEWVVAYEVDESGSTSNDVACVQVAGDSGTVGIAQLVAHDASDNEQNPAVCYLGQSALVVWSDEISVGGGVYDAFVANIDPASCGTCETSQSTVASSSALDTDYISAASKLSGDPTSTSGEALIVYESRDVATSERDIFVQAYDANDDGIATDLGGGCGSGGEARASCARVGNAAFQHRLLRAEPSAAALLLLSFGRIDAVCGSCTLVPDPFTAFPISTTTSAAGFASVTTPLPSSSTLDGLVFFDQWLVVPAGTPGCSFLSTDFSNALSVEIQ